MQLFDYADPMYRRELANKRRANCRACGILVPKGEGIQWYRKNNYHVILFYLCPECDRAAQTQLASGIEAQAV